VREALVHLLRGQGIRVLGSAGSAESGNQLVVRRRPDVAVIDIRLARESGVELSQRLLEQLPAIAILLYTGELIGAGAVASLLKAGARGIALKSGDASELVEAISCVAAGGTYVDSRLRSGSATADSSPTSGLSDREREIVRLVGSGLSNEAIAQALFLSPHTVRTHVRNALRKLGVSTRAQAVLALERAEGGFGRGQG